MQTLVQSIPSHSKRGFFGDPSLWSESGLDAVMTVMSCVDRSHYCFDRPYAHHCPVIGANAAGPVTMSKPIVHAFFLQQFYTWLNEDTAHSSVDVLDVGSGTGFLTVALARMLDQHGRRGEVVGIDVTDALVTLGAQNHSSDERNRDLAVSFRLENAEQQNLADSSRYSFIVVSATVKGDSPHPALLERLRIGGRIVAPVHNGSDEYFVTMVRIDEGEFSKPKWLCQARFVPLIGV